MKINSLLNTVNENIKSVYTTVFKGKFRNVTERILRYDAIISRIADDDLREAALRVLLLNKCSVKIHLNEGQIVCICGVDLNEIGVDASTVCYGASSNLGKHKVQLVHRNGVFIYPLFKQAILAILNHIDLCRNVDGRRRNVYNTGIDRIAILMVLVIYL